MRLLWCALFLITGFALVTYGLLGWQADGFSLSRVWPVGGEFAAHPVHALILGLALIPPSIWEMFLDDGRGRRP